MQKKKTFKKAKYAVVYVLVKKFRAASNEAKVRLFKSYCHPMYGCDPGVIKVSTAGNLLTNTVQEIYSLIQYRV